MKVVLINASPRVGRNSRTLKAFGFLAEEFKKQGVETEIVNIEGKLVHACTSCRFCANHDYCVFKDDLCNSLIEKVREADGLVLGSPVYGYQPIGKLVDLMIRVHRAGKIKQKVGGVLVTLRRVGDVKAINTLYPHEMGMGSYVAAGTYTYYGTGAVTEEKNDEIGLRNIRHLAQNMTFLMKAINSYDGEKPSLEQHYKAPRKGDPGYVGPENK